MSEYNEVKKILDANGITDIEEIEYGSECFDELMDYYADEMPYGVMKARTGMPDDIDKGIWSEFAEEEMFNNMPDEVDTLLNLQAESKRGK